MSLEATGLTVYVKTFNKKYNNDFLDNWSDILNVREHSLPGQQ